MSPVRILLAGLNNYRWRSYHRRLDDSGFSVRFTNTGVDCVAALREFRPNVLVLDPNIPFGGGDSVLAVRDEEPELKANVLMILTARCEPSLLYRLSAYRVDDLAGQPISAAVLQWRLECLLTRQQECTTPLTGLSTSRLQFRSASERVDHAERLSRQPLEHS